MSAKERVEKLREDMMKEIAKLNFNYAKTNDVSLGHQTIVPSGIADVSSKVSCNTTVETIRDTTKLTQHGYDTDDVLTDQWCRVLSSTASIENPPRFFQCFFTGYYWLLMVTPTPGYQIHPPTIAC